jgi:hypothetical protein
MERVTKQMLNRQVSMINENAGKPIVSLGWAYGGVRLESADGGKNLSCRGTKQEIYWQLVAFAEGFDLGRK